MLAVIMSSYDPFTISISLYYLFELPFHFCLLETNTGPRPWAYERMGTWSPCSTEVVPAGPQAMAPWAYWSSKVTWTPCWSRVGALGHMFGPKIISLAPKVYLSLTNEPYGPSWGVFLKTNIIWKCCQTKTLILEKGRRPNIRKPIISMLTVGRTGGRTNHKSESPKNIKVGYKQYMFHEIDVQRYVEQVLLKMICWNVVSKMGRKLQ